ncbi:MAG: hypothetical protein DRO67_01455 [Candidatus Asgardarchaeum californiense]|nr:MAG: hypothetical protein DRO67_01455 [Candidatus Asgardarchaeum californiense]
MLNSYKTKKYHYPNEKYFYYVMVIILYVCLECEEMSAPIVAYVLISVKTGFEYEVLEKIDDIEGVTEAAITFGEYDIIARVEVDQIGKLDAIVIKIRKIEGVERTSTLITA